MIGQSTKGVNYYEKVDAFLLSSLTGPSRTGEQANKNNQDNRNNQDNQDNHNNQDNRNN